MLSGKFALNAVLPVVVAAWLLVTMLGHYLYWFCTPGGRYKHEQAVINQMASGRAAEGPIATAFPWHKYSRAFIACYMYSYLSMAQATLRYLNCESVGYGVYVLPSSQAIQCDT